VWETYRCTALCVVRRVEEELSISPRSFRSGCIPRVSLDLDPDLAGFELTSAERSCPCVRPLPLSRSSALAKRPPTDLPHPLVSLFKSLPSLLFARAPAPFCQYSGHAPPSPQPSRTSSASLLSPHCSPIMSSQPLGKPDPIPLTLFANRFMSVAEAMGCSLQSTSIRCVFFFLSPLPFLPC
jgi:hypothetical protein